MGGATILKDTKMGHEHAKVCTKSVVVSVDTQKPYMLEYGLIGILLCLLQCLIILARHEVLQEGEKVKIFYPYDGSIASIGQIHSLSMIHGVALGPKDANINLNQCHK